jgi:transcriptional regulator with XRE-family HTH domain
MIGLLREVDVVASGLVAYLQGELKARGWTQTQLADRAGMHKATISKIFKNPDTIPDLDTLARLARGLDVPLTRLITICGFEPGDDDGQLDVERAAILFEAVPELRELADAAGQFSSAELRLLMAFVQGLRQQRGS